MINCIGDSHVSLFSGSDQVIPDYSSHGYDKNPNYRTHRLDPILMWLMNIIELK